MLPILEASDARALGRLLDRTPDDHGRLEPAVKDILSAVRKRGDRALIEFARKFDGLTRPIELSPAEISLPTQGATVTSAEAVAADDPANPLGAYCRVRGTIQSVDPAAQSIQFALTVADSVQGAALGSAISAAVAAGAYPDVPAAAAVMGRAVPGAYIPDPQRHAAYSELYADYLRLHDYFGRAEEQGGNEVLHRLRARRTGRPG